MEDFTFRRFNEQDAILLYTIDSRVKSSPRKKKAHSPSRPSHNYSSSYSSPRAEKTFSITSQSDIQYNLRSFDDYDSLLHLRYTIQSDIAQLLTEIHPLRKKLKDMEDKTAIIEVIPPQKTKTDFNTLENKLGENEHIRSMYSNIPIQKMKANLLEDVESLNLIYEQCLEITSEIEKTSRKKAIFLSSDIYKNVCAQRQKMSILDAKIEKEEETSRNLQSELEFLEKDQSIKNAYLSSTTDSPENISRLQDELVEKQATLKEAKERYSQIMEAHENEISVFQKEYSTSSSLAPPTKNNTYTNGRFRAQKQLRLSFNKNSDEFFSTFYSSKSNSNDFPNINNLDIENSENDKNTNDVQNKSKHRIHDKKIETDKDPIRKKTSDSVSPRQRKYSPQKNKPYHSRKSSDDSNNSTLNLSSLYSIGLPPSPRCISVGLFAKPIKEKEIKNLFSQYGEVEDIEIFTKTHVYPSQYYANIRFSNHESAQKSIDKANHKKYKDTILSVKWATNQNWTSSHQPESQQNTLKASNSNNSLSMTLSASPKPPQESSSKSPQRSTKSNKSKNQQTSSDKEKNNENPNSSSHINGKNIENNSKDFPVRQLNSHHKRVLSLSSTIVQEAPNKRKTDPNSLSEPDLTFSSEFAAIRNNNNTYSPNIRVSVQNSIISVESSLDLPEIVKYQESFIEKPVEKPKVKPPPKTANDIESKVSNKSMEKEKFQLPPLKLNLGQYVNNDQNINLSPIEKKKSDTTGFSFEEDDYDVNDISISNTVEDIGKIIKNNGKQSQSSDYEANSDSSRTLFSTDSEPDRVFNLLEISDSEKTTVNKKSPKLPPSSLVTSPRPRFLGVTSPRSKEAEDAKDKKKEEKTVSKDKPTSKPKVSRPKDNYPENKQEESIRFKLPAKKNQPSHPENNEKEENPRNKLPDKKGVKGKSSDSSDEESKEKSSDSIDITSSEENQKNKTVDQKDKSSNDSSSSDKKGNKKTLDQTFGFSVSGSNGNSEKEEEEEEEEKKEDKSTNETSITANSSISEKEKEKKEKSTLENTAKKMLDGTFGFSVSNSSGEESEDKEKDDQKDQKKVNTSDTEVQNNKNNKKSSSSNDGVLTTDSSSYENEKRDKNKSSSNYEKIDLDSSSYEKDNKSTTEETTSYSSNVESNSDQIHQKKTFTKKENTPNFKIENKNKPTPRKTKSDPSDNETIKVVKDDQAKKPKSVVSINFIQSSSEIVNKRSRKNEKEAKNGSTESFKFSDYSTEQLKNNKDGKIEKSKLIEKNLDTKKLQEKVNTIQKQKETIQRNNKSNTNINNMNDKNKKESSDSIEFTTSSLSDKNQKKQPSKQRETILDTKNTNQKKMNPKENKKENIADSTNKKSHKPEAIKIQPSSSNYEVLIIDSNSDENDEKESESSSSNIEVIDIESGSDEKDTEKETSDTSSDSESETDHSNHKKSSKSKGNNKKDNSSDSSEETEIKKENKSTSDKVDIPDTPKITPQKNSASLPKLKFKFFDKHIAPPSPSPSNDNEEKSDSSFSKSSINSSIKPVIDAIKDKNEKKEKDFDSSSSSDDEKKKSKKNDDFDSSDSDEKKDEDSFDSLNIKNSKTKDEDSFDFSGSDEKNEQKKVENSFDFTDSDEKEKQKKDEKSDNSSENISNSKSNNTITKSSTSTIEILSIFSSSDDEKKSEKDGKNKGQTSDSENQKVSSASDEIEEIDSSSSSSDKDKKDDFSSDIEVLDILSDSNEEKPKEKQKPQDISKSQMKQKKEFKKTNQNSDLGSTGPKKFPPLLNITAITKLSSTNPKK